MAQLALTRASTLGPVVEELRRGGASCRRVFNAADLPLELTQRPAALIPLRDQFKLVEYAARELGDDALPARLALAAGAGGLGMYGARFISAATLGEAIAIGNGLFTSILQSGTRMALTIDEGFARWSYEVLESQALGRQKNEILAVGYMIDLIRRFVDPRWIPSRVEVPGPALPARASIEALLRCEITRGDRLSVAFPSALLQTPRQRVPAAIAPGGEVRLPDWQDLPGSVRELIRLGLLGKRPANGWVASHLGLSVRTMQRCLKEQQTSFARMMQESIVDRAQELLTRGTPITELAIELGYSDPAHFTRAFQRALGVAPREWRRMNQSPGAADSASFRAKVAATARAR